jgi:hypothetical protein
MRTRIIELALFCLCLLGQPAGSSSLALEDGAYFVPADWWTGNITCSLEESHPSWFYFFNWTWEDMTLLNEYNVPTYAPPVANQTPHGPWNLTFTLGSATQYWAYLHNATSVVYPFGLETHPYDGPVTILLNTTFWSRGWVHVWVETAGEGNWERWLYVNDLLTLAEQDSSSVCIDVPIITDFILGVITTCVEYLRRLFSLYSVLFR